VLIALNKPFQVLTQFSPVADKKTLADFLKQPDVYAAGRLDFDSEGLLLLTDRGSLQHALSSPANKIQKRYWAQVEGVATEPALEALRRGVTLDGRLTAPAVVTQLPGEPQLWPRQPAIRKRMSIPTSWLEISIGEGRNRQVRRMTAAVGLPTLRLVRVGIGSLDLIALGLAPGAWIEVEAAQVSAQLLQKRTSTTIRRVIRGARGSR
jgi:23S rRNA pseudouridine2457 synthase